MNQKNVLKMTLVGKTLDERILINCENVLRVALRKIPEPSWQIFLKFPGKYLEYPKSSRNDFLRRFCKNLETNQRKLNANAQKDCQKYNSGIFEVNLEIDSRWGIQIFLFFCFKFNIFPMSKFLELEFKHFLSPGSYKLSNSKNFVNPQFRFSSS